MKKYLIGLGMLLGFACNSNNSAVPAAQENDFLPQNHKTEIDQACKPIISNYMELLKGLSLGDTAYFFNKNEELGHLTDSVALLNLTTDTSLALHFKNELLNVHAESEALKALRGDSTELIDHNELNISFHMLSMHLINLLGQVGYAAQNVYIFTVSDSQFEDGFKWISWQKQSRDPYHPKNRAEIMADQLLQHP
jgi:hypothetical protein